MDLKWTFHVKETLTMDISASIFKSGHFCSLQLRKCYFLIFPPKKKVSFFRSKSNKIKQKFSVNSQAFEAIDELGMLGFLRRTRVV